ncbi:hypothetical protein LZ554_005982 [Drepanopeziza brunnea f. sp. 'monogermtubi']|nr:hypothetical protein LZ554_005982 [Drepanopeziza brunnea f. sp. 'monogermtubi']
MQFQSQREFQQQRRQKTIDQERSSIYLSLKLFKTSMMTKFICQSCRASILGTSKARMKRIPSPRHYSSSEPPANPNPNPNPRSKTPVDIAALLSKPTWSVRSLIPSAPSPTTTEITPKKLHHLLRLSALPLPKTPQEEASMLADLHSQLHFVQDIQSVDTEGVEPLQSIRDETDAGVRDVTIGLEQMKEALAKEDVVGRNRRPRRRRGEKVDTGDVENWDVLGTAGDKVQGPGGSYFVVRGGKEEGQKTGD